MSKPDAVLLMTLSIIGLIIGVVLLLVWIFYPKEDTKKKIKDNKYTGVKAVSFFFPIIGLIIFALNIGKNDELAKICLKWVVINFVTIVVIFLIKVLFVFLYTYLLLKYLP